jgi:hypothetical protein
MLRSSRGSRATVLHQSCVTEHIIAPTLGAPTIGHVDAAATIGVREPVGTRSGWGRQDVKRGRSGVTRDRIIRNAATIAVLSTVLSGCGISAFTSGVGGSVFGSKPGEAQKIQSVTAEQMLTAAKSDSPLGLAESEVSHGCPRFSTAPRDKTVTVYEQGRVGDGLAVTHRGEITKTARECDIGGGRVTVKYGFAGRMLMGPKGKAGTVNMPVVIYVTDAKRERIHTERLLVDAALAVDKPVGYFSTVKSVTFTLPEGARPGEYEVFVGFDRNVPGAG